MRTKVYAVGMPVTRHPPHRSVRAELPHTALALSGDVGAPALVWQGGWVELAGVRPRIGTRPLTRVCARTTADTRTFLSANALPSTASAGSGNPLFGDFSGTMALSDSRTACALICRDFSFTNTALSPVAAGAGAVRVSRFPCAEFPYTPGSLTPPDSAAARP